MKTENKTISKTGITFHAIASRYFVVRDYGGRIFPADVPFLFENHTKYMDYTN